MTGLVGPVILLLLGAWLQGSGQTEDDEPKSQDRSLDDASNSRRLLSGCDGVPRGQQGSDQHKAHLEDQRAIPDVVDGEYTAGQDQGPEGCP